MSLAKDCLKLDAAVGTLSGDQMAALCIAVMQISAALDNLAIAIPDGAASPIAEHLKDCAESALLSWRPGKGFARIADKVKEAIAACPTLSAMGREFFARLGAK